MYFAFPVDGRPVTYHVAFGFEPGLTHGQGVVTAFAGDRAVSTGVVGADRVAAAADRSYLRVFGPLRGDAPGLPGLCVFAQVAPDLDRVVPVPSGLFAAFALKDGACDNDRPLGYGRLQ